MKYGVKQALRLTAVAAFSAATVGGMVAGSKIQEQRERIEAKYPLAAACAQKEDAGQACDPASRDQRREQLAAKFDNTTASIGAIGFSTTALMMAARLSGDIAVARLRRKRELSGSKP
jgi:hypothetical protein